MAITLVNSDGSDYSIQQGATFPSTPIEGNLLVCATSHRSAEQDASLTGWTKIFETDVLPADTTYRRALAVFAKIAGGSESSVVDPSWSSNATRVVVIAQFNAGSGREWDAVSGSVYASADNGQTTHATTVSTGTTASTANQLGVVFGCWKNTSMSATNFTLSISGYTFFDKSTGTSTNDMLSGELWQEYSGTAARGGTLTMTADSNTNNGLIGAVATFSHSATGGGVTPSPFGSQKLDNQYATIAASRLNGVLQ